MTTLNNFVLFLAHFIVGLFFVSYRFRWLWDPTPIDAVQLCSPARHQKLRDKLKECGWSPRLASLVAIGELAAGLGVMVGFLTPLSAAGLLIILVVANRCTYKSKIEKQNPIDKIDYFNCYLWTPEPLYMVLTLVVMVLGPGDWSVDHLLFGAI